MKIVEVQTVRAEGYAEFLAVVLKTDDGITGLGETCFGPESVEAYMHESVAPRLLGADPLTIERHARDLPSFYVTHGGTGVSTRAHSAVDIALWDLFGKVCNQPLYQLLGGKVREQARIYNTCGGYRYGQAEARYRGTSRPSAAGSAPPETGSAATAPPGPYEDLDAFLHRRRRAGPRPVEPGGDSHEDLAFRRGGASQRRSIHFWPRPAPLSRTVRKDKVGHRGRDRHHGRTTRPVGRGTGYQDL